jgi:hypothetical protein
VENIRQVTDPNFRFYTVGDGEASVPSVTTLFKAYPTPSHLIDYWKGLGRAADVETRRAADFGTNVHNALEKYALEGALSFFANNDPDSGKFLYSIAEWECICKGHNFFALHNVQPINVERKYADAELGYGGQVDLEAVIYGDRWIIDYKTSNYPSDTWAMQTMAYKNLVNASHPAKPITRRGVLWLKADTRGADRKGKIIQGYGWKLIEYTDDYLDNYKLDLTKKMFQAVHGKVKPAYKEYPTHLERGVTPAFEIKHTNQLSLEL